MGKTSKANDKTIRVTCEGAATLPLDDLTEIQGDLKSLSKTAYEKLRKSLLKHGISYPLFVWRNMGINATLDGNQRVRVLISLRDEGYVIPDLPVAFIEAADEKEAKEKILILCSQYGDYTSESVYGFIEQAGLSWPEIAPLLDLPQIDMKKYDIGWTDESNAVGGEPRSIGEKFMIVIDCTNEDQQKEYLERFLNEGMRCRALVS